jgi:hypothetical protein
MYLPMQKKASQPLWTRVVALASLLSALGLWTASASHIHNLANQNGVQQECQLCVASNTSHAHVVSAPVVAFFSLTLLPLILQSTLPHLRRFSLSVSPRSPPFS